MKFKLKNIKVQEQQQANVLYAMLVTIYQELLRIIVAIQHATLVMEMQSLHA